MNGALIHLNFIRGENHSEMLNIYPISNQFVNQFARYEFPALFDPLLCIYILIHRPVSKGMSNWANNPRAPQHLSQQDVRDDIQKAGCGRWKIVGCSRRGFCKVGYMFFLLEMMVFTIFIIFISIYFVYMCISCTSSFIIFTWLFSILLLMYGMADTYRLIGLWFTSSF